jgi:hypothetical protein
MTSDGTRDHHGNVNHPASADDTVDHQRAEPTQASSGRTLSTQSDISNQSQASMIRRQWSVLGSLVCVREVRKGNYRHDRERHVKTRPKVRTTPWEIKSGGSSVPARCACMHHLAIPRTSRARLHIFRGKRWRRSQEETIPLNPVMTAPYRPLTTSTPSPPLTPGSRDHSPTLSLRALELSESFVDDPDQNQRPRQNRSNTVTSFAGFEFEHELLPLTLSGEGADAEAAKKDDEKHVGLWHAIGLVVGMQVGSGIFSSPGVIVASVGSTGASLMVWVVSGLLAWTGAR